MSESPADEAPVKKSEGKRLTPAEWKEACALYETGSARVTEIAERFGISTSAVSQHFKNNGVVRGSKAGKVGAAIEEAVVAKVASEASTFEALRQKRIEETRTQHYNYASALASEIVRQVVEAKSSGRSVSSNEANIRTLRTAASALATLRQERFAILDADNSLDSDSLPVLEIADLSDADIANLQIDPDDLGLEAEEVIELDVEEEDEIVSEDGGE